MSLCRKTVNCGHFSSAFSMSCASDHLLGNTFLSSKLCYHFFCSGYLLNLEIIVIHQGRFSMVPNPWTESAICVEVPLTYIHSVFCRKATFVFSSPEHEVLMVSYCGQWLSVVRRRASCVVRRPSCVVRQHLMFTL